ncbi:MAG: helix-turn-helix domain-containing protein [Alphaproteobacteria bacterium]|nr:helix-turn-helix domain-containing protein [Alphaproteobacteria bacterium]
MEYSIKLFIWEGVVLYIGPLADNSEHRHHAAQICMGLEGSFRLFRDGSWHETDFAALAANEPHILDGGNKMLAIALLDGESSQGCLATKEASAPDILLPNLPNTCDEARSFVDGMVAHLNPHVHEKDPRIVKALTHISGLETKQITAPALAKIACLSESRFLHLWKEQVGLPLRRFLLWRRIMDTVDSILRGNDLTSAAHLGGFSDSAHFSRTFRETFGLSPSEIFKNSRNVQVQMEHLA